MVELSDRFHETVMVRRRASTSIPPLKTTPRWRKTMLDKKQKLSNKSPQAGSDAGHESNTPHAHQNRNPDLLCPAELPPLAREEWHRIVSELTLGILSKFDH